MPRSARSYPIRVVPYYQVLPKTYPLVRIPFKHPRTRFRSPICYRVPGSPAVHPIRCPISSDQPDQHPYSLISDPHHSLCTATCPPASTYHPHTTSTPDLQGSDPIRPRSAVISPISHPDHLVLISPKDKMIPLNKEHFISWETPSNNLWILILRPE